MRINKTRLVIAIVAIILISFSCSKFDKVAVTYNIKNVEEFFTAHPSQNIIANQLASYVKRKNAEENILQKIVNENGFAHWDKAMQKEKNTFRPTANGDSTDVYYVPIAQPNTTIVNASVVITTTPTDTTLGFTYDWQYTAEASSNTIMGDARKQFAILFMYMNKTVFGQPSYKILDPTLFNLNGRKPISITITSSGNNSSTSGLLQQQVCIVVSTTYNTCPYLAAGQQCVGNSLLPTGTGTCDNCSYCTTTVTNTYCVENCHSCGGGTTGNGNTNTNNNGNNNTGNGNTGGSGSGTTTSGNNTNTNTNGGTGWIPNVDENGNPISNHYNNPVTPCATVDSLKANTSFKQKFTTLKSKTTDNKEYMYTYTFNGGFKNGLKEVDSAIGLPNNAGIQVSVPFKIDGVMHSHYSNLLSIFSPDDIFTLTTLYKANRINSVKNFTMGVVTASGTQYMIMIGDSSKFATFANSLDTVGSNQYYNYQLIYNKIFNIKETGSVADNEKAFLQYIKKNDMGLTLFKGNSDFSIWDRKKLDANEDVTNDPCL
jgi:hypothetical protein